jgi:hypothetical protein
MDIILLGDRRPDIGSGVGLRVDPDVNPRVEGSGERDAKAFCATPARPVRR